MTLHVRLLDPISGVVLERETVATLRAAVQGPRGLSAYQVAVANGYDGTEEDWLESIGSGGGGPGDPGASAYEVAVANGFVGDEAAWLASLEGGAGDPGASAYEVAVANGFVGDEAAWLASLEGGAGDPGADGTDGTVPVVGELITGRYYALGGIGIGAGIVNVAGEIGRVDLAPRVRRRLFGTLAGIGVHINAGVPGGIVRIVIYTPDADGWPDELLWNSGDLTATAFAFREVTAGLPDIDAHELLWYGIAHTSTGNPGAQIRSHNIVDTIEIGGWAPGATPAPNPGTVIRRTGVSLGALPDPWVFSATELAAQVSPPLIYLRPS